MLSDERFVGVASKISCVIRLDSNTELTKISSDFVCLFMSQFFFSSKQLFTCSPVGRGGEWGGGEEKWEKP
jgi:hypothetical protein